MKLQYVLHCYEKSNLLFLHGLGERGYLNKFMATPFAELIYSQIRPIILSAKWLEF